MPACLHRPGLDISPASRLTVGRARDDRLSHQKEIQMSDKEFVIEMEDDTEGHAVRRAVIEPEDSQWLEDRLRQDNGKTNFRIVLRDEDEEDTEGHDAGGTTLRLNLVDDDDTEGHAIAIHFPSRADADAFRRRLLVTGVLVGTVALGAAGGVGLSALQSDADAGAGVTQSQAYTNMQEAAANEGARQGSAQAADAQAYANYQEAAANEGARQGGGAAAQTGPMDVHEAPAFQSGGASSIDADRDIGIMDASGAAAGTQTGPMDVHEAPAFQNQSTDDDGSPELNDIGGPTPR